MYNHKWAVINQFMDDYSDLRFYGYYYGNVVHDKSFLWFDRKRKLVRTLGWLHERLPEPYVWGDDYEIS